MTLIVRLLAPKYILLVFTIIVFYARPAYALVFYDSGQQLGNYFSNDVALGDVDGDGDLDAFVVNGTAGNKVWLNNGSGVFTDSGQSLGTSTSKGVALGDLDGDGDLDAFVANGPDLPDKVWLNNGAGVFTDSGQSLGALWSEKVALGDLDGDGDLDAVVATINSNSRVWLNDGSGAFTDSGQSVGALGDNAVALGDLDGDGDLDAYFSQFASPNTVWFNNGSGIFTDSGQLLGNNGSYDVALGDLDGDGDLDAFEVNINSANIVWLNNGSGSFTDSGQALGNNQSMSVALGDFDGDGDLDVLEGTGDGDQNHVWLNDGSGIFTDIGQIQWYYRANYGIGLGDLDGDGDLDAFLANSGAPSYVWFWGGNNLTAVVAGAGVGWLGDTLNFLDMVYSCFTGSSETWPVNAGVPYTLYSHPATGSALVSWSEATCPGNVKKCSFSMASDHTVTATFEPDNDHDNVADVIENAGPNGGDGNLDGTLDSQQSNVATLQDVFGNWCTLVTETAGTSISKMAIALNPSTGDFPATATDTCGFFEFILTPPSAGAAAAATTILHTQDTTLNDYWKYGPTPGNPANHWYRFMYNGTTGAQISNTGGKTYITLHFVDGQLGDDDLTANGSITDIGGPVANTDPPAPWSGTGSGGGGGGGGCFIQSLH